MKGSYGRIFHIKMYVQSKFQDSITHLLTKYPVSISNKRLTKTLKVDKNLFLNLRNLAKIRCLSVKIWLVTLNSMLYKIGYISSKSKVFD